MTRKNKGTLMIGLDGHYCPDCKKKVTSQECFDKLGAIETMLNKYSIEDLDYLEQCIIRSDKYGELEEYIGCPLDVKCRVKTESSIFLPNGKSYMVTGIRDTYFRIYDPATRCYETVSYSEYMKSWWFKADRSE